MAHVGRIVDGRTAVVPRNDAGLLRDEFDLQGKVRDELAKSRKNGKVERTFERVSEL